VGRQETPAIKWLGVLLKPLRARAHPVGKWCNTAHCLPCPFAWRLVEISSSPWYIAHIFCGVISVFAMPRIPSGASTPRKCIQLCAMRQLMITLKPTKMAAFWTLGTSCRGRWHDSYCNENRRQVPGLNWCGMICGLTCTTTMPYLMRCSASRALRHDKKEALITDVRSISGRHNNVCLDRKPHY
jgi:hypothetical protein